MGQRRSTSVTRALRYQSPEPPPRLNRGHSSELSSLLPGNSNNNSPVMFRRNFPNRSDKYNFEKTVYFSSAEKR